MTVAVEEKLRNEIAELKAEVARLERELQRSQVQEAVRRGLDEADRGMVIPARELVAQLRKKHGLPSP